MSGTTARGGHVQSHRFLLNEAYDAAQELNTHAADVNAVQGDLARKGFVKAHEHGHYSGLSAARRSHDARQFSGG